MMRDLKKWQFRIIFILAAAILVSCGSKSRSWKGNSKSAKDSIKLSLLDSMIVSAESSKDYVRKYVLADSLEKTGDFSAVKANYLRGTAMRSLEKKADAELYFKKALEVEDLGDKDVFYYMRSARVLSQMLSVKNDYESVLRVATPAVEKLDGHPKAQSRDLAVLYYVIGSAQMYLGVPEDGEKSFEKAFEHYKISISKTDTNGSRIRAAVLGVNNITVACLNTHNYKLGKMWNDRTDSLLYVYRLRPDADPDVCDHYRARILLFKALAAYEAGHRAEAETSFDAFQKTEYASTEQGKLDANDYLMKAHRFAEAAANFRTLDHWVATRGMKMNLDNISLYLVPKYRAHIGAGHKDSAIYVANQIINAYDSALVWSKRDDTAEMATIYETHQKEQELAQSQYELEKRGHEIYRQRLISFGIGFLLFSGFLVFYTLYKRKAYKLLQDAYSQLEEATSARERIESELRIARDIQMSMIPASNLESEGLDLFASMTPAKEVGGDLYDYFLEKDHLYIAIGDVSGKGVPASLFMAQVIRLFRAMAKQHYTPAEICTRINNELTENNENGMFITMFIGLVDLTSGRLDFCNAGHNPPVLGGDADGGNFLQMIPNAPIGLWQGLEYEGEYIDSIKGKPLFIYTDGLNEAENPELERFGDDHMLEVLRETKFSSAMQVVESLKRQVEEHRRGAEPNDDLTMMCLKVG
jgi:serine phosphatase RsbU (regulator of sigma subunit)